MPLISCPQPAVLPIKTSDDSVSEDYGVLKNDKNVLSSLELRSQHMKQGCSTGYLYWYWYLELKYWYLYLYLRHGYWYWYWYLRLKYWYLYWYLND